MEKKKVLLSTLLLFVIAAGGLCLRTVQLGEVSLSFPEPLHIYAAKSLLETGKPTLPSGIDYPRGLIFTRIVAFSFKVFGVNTFAARLPSAFFGTLSIILIFFIGGRLFGNTAGLISAFITAFVPFEVVWSRECRMYTMFQFFFLLTFFAFYEGFEKKRKAGMPPSNWNLDWKWLVLSSACFYIAFRTHILAGVFSLSLLLYFFFMFLFSGGSGGVKSAIKSKYFLSFLFILAVGVSFLVLFPGFVDTLQNSYRATPLWVGNSAGSPLYYFHFLIQPWLFPIAALFIIGIIQIGIKTHRPGFYTLICIAVPLIFHSVVKLKQARYIIPVFPLISLVSAYGLIRLFDVDFKNAVSKLRENKKINIFSPKRLSFVVFTGLFSIWFLSALGWFYQSFKLINHPVQAEVGGEHHAQWKEACLFLEKAYRPGDVVIATIPLAAKYHFGRVDYALDRAHYLGSKDYPLDKITLDLQYETTKDEFPIDFYAGVKTITDLASFKRVLSENSRGWLILDRQRFESDSLVPDNLREFIVKNLTEHRIEANETMFVFSWDR